MSTSELVNIPVFILAGGLGTRLKEHTEFRPKPMLEIGHHPVLWHIMRWYGWHGFKRFVICSGFRSEVIKEYFLNYGPLNSDFTVDLATREVTYHSPHHDEDWEVTIAYTGELTMTGGRLARATEKYLGSAQHFALTYGDGLCDVDLAAEYAFHCQHNRIGTVLAVNAPTSRFGEMHVDINTVTDFSEKPELRGSWINGGYFFFRREFLRYLSSDEQSVLETGPLMMLVRDRQLNIYRHEGFWACLDTQRDRDKLDELWASGRAPWAINRNGAMIRDID